MQSRPKSINPAATTEWQELGEMENWAFAAHRVHWGGNEEQELTSKRRHFQK